MHRSHRYREDKFPWAQIVEKYGDRMVFSGYNPEWAEFIERFGRIHYHSPTNLLELARVIAGGVIFIGNQSCPYAIAEGLKVDSIQETWKGGPNCIFNRPNGFYDVLDFGRIEEKIEESLLNRSSLYRKAALRKISFCITCKNRLENLKYTLPINLEATVGYPRAEFVLLDYSSQDGLESWVLKTFKNQIGSGRLVVYASRGQPWFHMAHAKNLAHRLGGGDILVNLDSDNVIGHGYAEYLNDEFNSGTDLVFSPHPDGTHGRIAITRAAFYKLGGYDEGLSGYGWDDNDMKARASRMGMKLVVGNRFFYGCLPDHGSSNRSEWQIDPNESNEKNRLQSLANLLAGRYVANDPKPWGEGLVKKNYQTLMEV